MLDHDVPTSSPSASPQSVPCAPTRSHSGPVGGGTSSSPAGGIPQTPTRRMTKSEARVAKTRATNAAKMEAARKSPTFPLDCRVRVNNPRVPKYHGRTGVVRSHHMGEIGLVFGAEETPGAWFAPRELVRL